MNLSAFYFLHCDLTCLPITKRNKQLKNINKKKARIENLPCPLSGQEGIIKRKKIKWVKN